MIRIQPSRSGSSSKHSSNKHDIANFATTTAFTDNDNDTDNHNHKMLGLTIFHKQQQSPRRGYNTNTSSKSFDDDYLLPDMIESPTGSTSSSGEFLTPSRPTQPNQQNRNEQKQNRSSFEITESPPSPPALYSSSSRMQERFSSALRAKRFASEQQIPTSPVSSTAQTRRHRNRRIDSNIDINHNYDDIEVVGEPSNTSILMGADIIRRQLSGENPESPPAWSKYRSPSRYQSPGRSKINTNTNTNDNNRKPAVYEWDPWKPDQDFEAKKNRIKNNLRGRALDYSQDVNNGNNNKYSNNNNNNSNNNTKKVAGMARSHQRVQAILNAGDTYVENQQSSTMAPRGSALSKNRNAQSASIDVRKVKKVINNTANCMVQRVSSMDNSTFASSSHSSGGYLPHNLIAGLTCGALNNNAIMSKCGEEHPDSLPPTTPDEELETKTLDFLANLHSKEEDLAFLLRSDPPQVQSESCNATLASSEMREIPTVASSRSLSPSLHRNRNRELASSSFVTKSATPFEKMLSAKSSLHSELLKNPAFRHALRAGTLWQSLCSQHVRFPAHWWDGQTPVGPPLGSYETKKHQRPWSYLGRHRIQKDSKLQTMIGNRASSGRLLLHLIVRDEISGKPIEDIACGSFHPNARGIRTTPESNPKLEDCRDVWIAHRRRAIDRVLIQQEGQHNGDTDTDDDEDDPTTIESLLRHQNKNRVHSSPLGAQGNGKHAINNDNLRLVFGSKPPIYTVFCLESDLFELFQSKLDGSIPASVALLRHYLKYEMK